MSDMMLNLTIVPVGPRDTFRASLNEKWRFAMQLAISFTEAPPDGEIPRWAHAMLPWIALGRPVDKITIAWRLFRKNKALMDAGTFGMFDAQSEGTLNLPVRDEIENVFWRQFVEQPRPKREFVLETKGEPVPTDTTTMLLPAVLQSLGGSTPEVSSQQLQCTWYFDVKVTQAMLNALDGDDPLGIAAWPVHFLDERTMTEFEYRQNDDNAFRFVDRTVLIRYRAGGGEPFDHARTVPFDVRRLLDTPEPALKTYWLPTADSRLDSLAEIETVLAQALSFRARVAFLTPDLIKKAGIQRPTPTDAEADARLFLEIARKVFEKDPTPDPVKLAAEIAGMIKNALAQSKQDVVEKLRAEIATKATEWWGNGVVRDINAAALRSGATKEIWSTGVPPSFKEFADLLLPETVEIKPVLPGEGIDVLLGAADTRLRHDDAETANDSDHAQIAELGVLVRRARELDLLTEKSWSLATATVAVLDRSEELNGDDRYWGSEQPETVPHSNAPVVRGIRSAFINGLSSTDITYRGTPLVAATIGSALHGNVSQESEAPDDFPEMLPLSYQAVGPVKEKFPARSPFCLVPPLRYGDWYQFAGFVIDRGGGIPAELANANMRPLSCNFDWDKLVDGQLGDLDDRDPATGTYKAIQFLRRVPVGEVNIQPLQNASPKDKPPEWPALPAGVVLRSREWLSTRAPKADSVPALLLSGSEDFVVRTLATGFRAGAPLLDEHTLSRWLMPSALRKNEDPQASREALEKLNIALADIHRKRALLPERTPDWKNEVDVLPFDPAVAGIGLRCTFVDESGRATESETFLGVNEVISVELANENKVNLSKIMLRPGAFASLELVPLVRMADFDERFDALAMRELVEDEPWIDESAKEFKAFRPARVIIEAASSVLPDPKELYEALTVTELDNGAIDVSLSAKNGGALAGMAFVDRFELARQRWVWRNRPIFTPADAARQSELPVELATAGRDDHLRVLRFDALAELDRGMVDRGRVGGRVPRAADGTPLPTPRLMVDDRDAVSHADYVRFGCTLISRYEGILRPDKRQTVAQSVHQEAERKALEAKRLWRRVTARFRGDVTLLKAPRVLAILPLTESLGEIVPMPDVSVDATPFLIVLDEVWFREYGPGERLSVEVVLESKEIGEGDEASRPFRVGPLPDHYIAKHLTGGQFTNRRLYLPSTDKVQDKVLAERKPFPLFGPFGHSLDRSGNEALANATAFIAYPPKNVAPHYAAFVRMRRVLHNVDGTIAAEGPPGGTYALYTQPDARQLITASTGTLQMRGLRYDGLSLDLRPAADTVDSVASQYRYLLITGPNLRDFGRGSQLFLPRHAAWLNADQSLRWVDGVALPKGAYFGRVVELLLNGRFAPEQSPIESKKSLRAILQAMFANDGNPEDAPGMIRRISPTFAVSVS